MSDFNKFLMKLNQLNQMFQQHQSNTNNQLPPSNLLPLNLAQQHLQYKSPYSKAA